MALACKKEGNSRGRYIVKRKHNTEMDMCDPQPVPEREQMDRQGAVRLAFKARLGDGGRGKHISESEGSEIWGHNKTKSKKDWRRTWQ